MPLAINTKKTKYLGINLMRHVKYLYAEITNADKRNQRPK